MIPNIDRWFYNADLNVVRSHIVVPEKQFSQARRVNICDAGEIQNDVVTARFFGRQDPRLDACGGVTPKLTGKSDDFRLLRVLFTNLKHRIYLRAMKGVAMRVVEY